MFIRYISLMGILSAAVGLLAQTPVASKSKGPASPGYLHGPIPQNPTSLGPGFLGHDIRAVIANFEKSAPGPKSEFETTEQYEARLATSKHNQQQYVFVNDPIVDAYYVGDELNDPGEFVYNADGHRFFRTIKMYHLQGVIDGVFVLRSNTTATGQYVATNAFGVRKVVTRFVKNVYELRVTDGYFVVGDRDWSINIAVPMQVTEAISLKNHLRLAFVCTISGSEVKREDQTIEATASDPREVQLHEIGLPVRIDKLWVFDSRTGGIIWRD